jgi:hypothetical protein
MAMRRYLDRPARVLPLAMALTAAGVVLLRRHRAVARLELEVVLAIVGAGLLGLLARVLELRGHRRSALGLRGGVSVAALLLFGSSELPAHHWLDALGILMCSGPLFVALYAVNCTRGTAAFAVGASLAAAISWYAPPTPTLAMLAFLFGRDAVGVGETASRRLALSLVGAGALAVVLTTAIGFEIIASAHDAFRADTRMSGSYVDGPLTFFPRLALEITLLAATLAHARGRAWGVLAFVALTPSLVVLTWGRLPGLWSGCMGWSHPLENLVIEQLGGFEIALALIVAPWLGPFVRALRSAR